MAQGGPSLQDKIAADERGEREPLGRAFIRWFFLPVTAVLRFARRRLPNRKRCPDCAETIQAEARVCRFCGYRYG